MNIRFSILDLLLVMTMIAVQFRTDRGMEIGLAVTLMILFFGVVMWVLDWMVAKNRANTGQVEKVVNRKILNTVLVWSAINFFVLMVALPIVNWF